MTPLVGMMVSVVALAIGALALRAFGGEPRARRLLLAMVWAGSALVLPVHLAELAILSGAPPSSGLRVGAALLVLLIGAGLLRQRPSEGAGRSVPVPWSGRERLAWAAWAGATLVFAVHSVGGLPAGWDARVYHLPVAVAWMQAGHLGIDPAADWRFALPGNFELTTLPGLSLGWEGGATLGNLGACLLAMLAVGEIAARTRSGRVAARWVMLFVGCVPMVQYQTWSGYLDLFGSAFIAAGLAVLSVNRRIDRRQLLTAGLAWGVAIGTKPTFWFFVGVLAIGVLAWRAVMRRPIRTADLAAVAIGMVATGGFWFVRAVVETGNPVYPLHVEVGGQVWFSGWRAESITPATYDRNIVSEPWKWIIYPWIESKRVGYGYGTGSGLGAVWATFVPVSLAWLAGRTVRDLRRRRWSRQAALAVFLLVGAAAWWTLLHRLPRFGMPIVLFTLALTAPAMARMVRFAPGLTGTLAAMAVILTVSMNVYIPAFRSLERARHGWTSRADKLDYPAEIESLAAGTRIWNLSGHPMDNYGLAGKDLALHVIPNPWPDEPTETHLRQALASADPDVIVDRIPFREDLDGHPDLALLVETTSARGDRWRLYERRRAD